MIEGSGSCSGSGSGSIPLTSGSGSGEVQKHVDPVDPDPESDPDPQHCLKVNLKEKTHLFVNSTTNRCLNKTIKTFLIEDFFHFPPLSKTPKVYLEQRISQGIFEKV
jgi:hypothetical protein